MGIDYSPQKLLDIIKNKDRFLSQQPVRTAGWYFSEEAKKQFESTDSRGKRVMFIFDYLTLIAQTPSARDTLFKLAYVIESAVCQTGLEYASYPDFLDPKKNFMVKLIKETDIKSLSNGAFCVVLLSVLHGSEDLGTASDYLKYGIRAYKRLQYCGEGEKPSDLYKLERTIISAFSDHSYLFASPFLYDIAKSQFVDSDTEDDE